MLRFDALQTPPGDGETLIEPALPGWPALVEDSIRLQAAQNVTLAGVPYDGADPKYESLYHPPFPESARYPANPPEAWKRAWYLRVKDLIDQYRPDVMYFDGGYPFDEGRVGRRLAGRSTTLRRMR